MAKWTKTPPAIFDSLGVATSWLCLLHCVGLPLVLLFLPTLGSHLCHDDRTHLCLAGWVLLFAVLSILPDYRKRKNFTVVSVMVLGVCAVLVATFGPKVGMSEAMEVPLITVGNLLVIGAHQLNRRLRCCEVHQLQASAVGSN